MKKVVLLAILATLVPAAAQANNSRQGSKKAAQKVDAAVTTGLLGAIEKAQREHEQDVLYADAGSAGRTGEGELCRRMGAFLDACDKGSRPRKAASDKKKTVKKAAPAKTPEQKRAEAEKAKKDAERKKREREAFWQMYYEALSNIYRAGK